MIVKQVDMILAIGTAIYAFGMLRGYQAYRFFQYRKKRKELLDRLL